MHTLGRNATNKMQATHDTIYKNQNGPVFAHLIILLAKQLTAIQAMISYEQKEWGEQL